MLAERAASQAIVAKPSDLRQAGLFDAPLPSWIKPCLPTLVDKPPVGPHWVHEIKWDGYRVSAYVVLSAAEDAVFAAYGIPAGQSAFYGSTTWSHSRSAVRTPFRTSGRSRGRKPIRRTFSRSSSGEVCHGFVSQAQAPHEIADDWIAAYRR